MSDKFLKIINEEISKFDFLSNDEFLKTQEITDLLMDEEFQKQFIYDSLLGNNKIKIGDTIDSQITIDSDIESVDRLSLKHSIKIEYKYDSTKKPIKFNLFFDGEDIKFNTNNNSWEDNFDWLNIEISIRDSEQNEIRFNVLNDAQPRIQILFIKQYVQNIIRGEILNNK